MSKAKNLISQNRSVMLILALVFLGSAYILGSLAIDSGRLLHYFLTIATLIVSLKFMTKFIKSYGNE